MQAGHTADGLHRAVRTWPLLLVLLVPLLLVLLVLLVLLAVLLVLLVVPFCSR